MQTTSNDGKFNAVQVVAMAGASRSVAATVPTSYQPSQPHVLTDELKAQLAATNQLRRENLYPRLLQTLATIEQGAATYSQSHERVMSLEELAEANRERRNRLRQSPYPSAQQGMA